MPTIGPSATGRGPLGAGRLPAWRADASRRVVRSGVGRRSFLARGEASAAILVRPTRLEQLAEVASAGDVMPQKSTYFYPKLLTGMVFNPLED